MKLTTARLARYGRCLLITTCLALCSLALATTFERLTLSQMFERSELAFLGMVTDVLVEEIEGEPWTVVTFEVEEALRGELEASVELAFYGGISANGVNVQVSGMPRLLLRQRVLILAYDRPYYSPIVGFSQGLWRVTGLGLQDEEGRLLSLSEGELQLDGVGASLESLLEALREALGGQP